jgi:hypothetical protein
LSLELPLTQYHNTHVISFVAHGCSCHYEVMVTFDWTQISNCHQMVSGQGKLRGFHGFESPVLKRVRDHSVPITWLVKSTIAPIVSHYGRVRDDYVTSPRSQALQQVVESRPRMGTHIATPRDHLRRPPVARYQQGRQDMGSRHHGVHHVEPAEGESSPQTCGSHSLPQRPKSSAEPERLENRHAGTTKILRHLGTAVEYQNFDVMTPFEHATDKERTLCLGPTDARLGQNDGYA